MTINAFHPKYIETHSPEFLTVFRKEAKQVEDGKFHATKSKAVRESVQSGNAPIDSFPKTKKAMGAA